MLEEKGWYEPPNLYKDKTIKHLISADYKQYTTNWIKNYGRYIKLT